MSMPTDNGKDYFVKDFYKRTLKLLTSYDGEYDVAMMINSMVGLLVVPKEQYFRSKKVDDSYVDAALLKQIQSLFRPSSEIDLTQILRCLRNAVAHGNMVVKAEQPNNYGDPIKIRAILFSDRNGTSAEIPVDLLKKFLISFATCVCETADGKENES